MIFIFAKTLSQLSKYLISSVSVLGKKKKKGGAGVGGVLITKYKCIF